MPDQQAGEVAGGAAVSGRSPSKPSARVPKRWCSSPPASPANDRQAAIGRPPRLSGPGSASAGQGCCAVSSTAANVSPVIWVAKPVIRPAGETCPFAVGAGQADQRLGVGRHGRRPGTGPGPARRRPVHGPCPASSPTSLVSSPRITSGTPPASRVAVRPGTRRQVGTLRIPDGDHGGGESPPGRPGRGGRAPRPSPAGCRPCRQSRTRSSPAAEPGGDGVPQRVAGSRSGSNAEDAPALQSRRSMMLPPASQPVGAEVAVVPQSMPIIRPRRMLQCPWHPTCILTLL